MKNAKTLLLSSLLTWAALAHTDVSNAQAVAAPKKHHIQVTTDNQLTETFGVSKKVSQKQTLRAVWGQLDSLIQSIAAWKINAVFSKDQVMYHRNEAGNDCILIAKFQQIDGAVKPSESAEYTIELIKKKTDDKGHLILDSVNHLPVYSGISRKIRIDDTNGHVVVYYREFDNSHYFDNQNFPTPIQAPPFAIRDDNLNRDHVDSAHHDRYLYKRIHANEFATKMDELAQMLTDAKLSYLHHTGAPLEHESAAPVSSVTAPLPEKK